MSQAVDTVKRRLIYIPDDEQAMLNELQGAPSHRASRMSRLLITRSPCLSQGNRTPPQPSFTSTSPSLQDLPPTTSLVVLSASAANCLNSVTNKRSMKHDAFSSYRQGQQVNSICKRQQNGVHKDIQSATNKQLKQQQGNSTEVTQVGKARSKRGRAHIADSSLHTFTPTPLPRRGVTPTVDKSKVDALLLVSYDGFLLADGSGHICPPRTAAETRKVINALEQCKVYLMQCASSSSVASLFRTGDATTQVTPMPTPIPLQQQRQQAQIQQAQLKKQLQQKQDNQQQRKMHKVCNGAHEENDSWNDDEFTNLSSNGTTSNSLLSQTSSSLSDSSQSRTSSTASSTFSHNQSICNSQQQQLQQQQQQKQQYVQKEQNTSSTYPSRSNSSAPTKKHKPQHLSQQERSRVHQTRRVGEHTSSKQYKNNKLMQCSRAKTSDRKTGKHERQFVKTNQCTRNDNSKHDNFELAQIAAMTAKTLRGILGQYGLSTNGSKCVLRSRLKRYWKRKQALQQQQQLLQQRDEQVQQLQTDHISMQCITQKQKHNVNSRRTSGRISEQSNRKANQSTSDLSISFSTSTEDHNSNRTSSIISRRSTCLPQLSSNATTSTFTGVPLQQLPSSPSISTTPTQSTRLQLLRSSYSAPAKPNSGFWSTLMTAGSRLFSRTSNLPENSNSNVHSQEVSRAQSLPPYKRRRSAQQHTSQ